ncbi:hypothetical protein [Salmonella enterica]|uniref:hypothetical protein n=1 Tax=Salmonella enterica TaxID=28901 RepID=UPI001602429A|nr:hypothetical protein [Salmonella enterica]
MTNNKLTEWRSTLDKCVENYQSTRAWYEENRDSPAALDDMERAEDQLTKFVRKYGFRVVLDLLDEIDELQERRKTEPVAYLVCNGRLYQDRPFLDLSTARKSVKGRNDGAEIKALCVCEISEEK